MPRAGLRGDRTAGAVSPLLLLVGGLLVSLVASALLVLQVRGRGEVEVTPPTAVATSTPQPTAAAPPVPPDDPPTLTTTSSATGTTSKAPPSTTAKPRPTTEEPPAAAAAPAEPDPAPAPAATPKGPASPSWISIAAGGVDGPIVPQGLAADGTINPGRGQIIWFTGYDRVAPGQVGTSVIAAHVTWAGAPDAFINLPAVGIGDVVTVGYSDGTSSSFTVVQTMAVDKDDLARSPTVWGAHPGVPRLAIITCDPALGYQADGHTAANFVVIAEA